MKSLSNQRKNPTPPDDRAEGILKCGEVVDNMGISRSSMRKLDSFACVFVYDGCGSFLDSSGREIEVSSGDLLLLFPGLAHAYGAGGDKTWSELFAIFEGPSPEAWLEDGLLDCERPVLHLEPVEYWLRRFREVLLPEPLRPSESAQRYHGLLALLAEALGSHSEEMSHSEAEWLRKACRAIEADLRIDAELEAAAPSTGVGYESMRKKFQKLAGMTPRQYLVRRVMDRASTMLIATDHTVESIADELGFADPFHFSRRFKQHSGKSPRDFRARA